MAFSLYGEPARAPAVLAPFLKAVLGWIQRSRARRARRAALRQLLEFEPSMLDDIGLDRATVLDALCRPDEQAGGMLEARRVRVSQDRRHVK